MLLVFPPQWDPSLPPLGIASLAAWLRTQGVDVEAWDLNLEAYRLALRRAALLAALRRVKQRLTRLDVSPGDLDPLDREEYARLGRLSLSGRYVAGNALEALSALSPPAPGEGMDFSHGAVPCHEGDGPAGLRRQAAAPALARYLRGFAVVAEALDMVSAPLHPTRWSWKRLSLGAGDGSLQLTLEAALDPNRNLFLPLLRAAAARVERLSPDLLGISLISPTQLLCGAALARLIRSRRPDIPLVGGGGAVTRLIRGFPAAPRLFQDFSYLIPGEGERPLLDLCRQIAAASGQGRVGGARNHAGPLVLGPAPAPRPENLPAPQFDDLDPQSYLSPRAVLPLLTSRGCYWGRCAFCDHHLGYPPGCAERPIERVVEDMAQLSGRHGVRSFMLCDEGPRPARLRALSRALRERGLEIAWCAEARPEPAFTPELARDLAAGGCRLLLFGVESGSDGVLKAMRKGLTARTASRALRSTAASGIWNHAFLITGFPGETPADVDLTRRWVEQNRAAIHSLALSPFALAFHSPIHQRPEEFGVAVAGPPGPDDLALSRPYRPLAGPDPAEVWRNLPALERSLQGLAWGSRHWSHIPRAHLLAFLEEWDTGELASLGPGKGDARGAEGGGAAVGALPDPGGETRPWTVRECVFWGRLEHSLLTGASCPPGTLTVYEMLRGSVRLAWGALADVLEALSRQGGAAISEG
ncbi:MAG: B12-binding domain-containing radical SAM protein, partial [Acetobacteraceae bacterium]|nr:B12-binding domain-containing radical SAM protein [Acetobacteraceae bacterium]